MPELVSRTASLPYLMSPKFSQRVADARYTDHRDGPRQLHGSLFSERARTPAVSIAVCAVRLGSHRQPSPMSGA